MRYRTPADVRAIPNRQWERWARGEEAYPGVEFSSEWSVQKTARTILEATKRRLKIKPPEKTKPKTRAAEMRELEERMQIAYAAFRQHVLERGFIDLEEMDA